MRGQNGGLRRLSVVLAALLLAVSTSFVNPRLVSANPATEEAGFVSDINSLRASRGLAPMHRNSHLDTMARNWVHVIAGGTLRHNPNLGAQAPPGWQKMGENVGRGGLSRAPLFQAFVNSPSHYANLVDPQFNQVGVAVAFVGNQMWTVHVFMAHPVVESGTSVGSGPSEAARYLQSISAGIPSAAKTKTLIGQKATGKL